MNRSLIPDFLRCKCGRQFIFREIDNIWYCKSCEESKSDRLDLIGNADVISSVDIDRSAVSVLKSFFKKFPKLYYYLAYFFGGRQVNMTAKKFVEQILPGKIIINIGSGTKILREDVINIDFYPFPGVQLVSRAEDIPFSDNIVDAVVCDNVLEHTKRPELIIKEINRVLKPGGKVYVGVPFIINYHSSPHDFHRWTAEGLRELMNIFAEDELKIACGPTSALAAILAEWLAIALSFNINFLYNIFVIILTIALAPLKLLDYIFSYYQSAVNIAYGFYFVGRKK